MTEYDYSPEAYERALRTQRRISAWVDQTGRHEPANPFVPLPNDPQLPLAVKTRALHEAPDRTPSPGNEVDPPSRGPTHRSSDVPKKSNLKKTRSPPSALQLDQTYETIILPDGRTATRHYIPVSSSSSSRPAQQVSTAPVTPASGPISYISYSGPAAPGQVFIPPVSAPVQTPTHVYPTPPASGASPSPQQKVYWGQLQTRNVYIHGVGYAVEVLHPQPHPQPHQPAPVSHIQVVYPPIQQVYQQPAVVYDPNVGSVAALQQKFVQVGHRPPTPPKGWMGC